jgi:hypothetical protein
MEANQYKRVLENGDEIQACSPSDVKYALTKDYTYCQPYEDINGMKVYNRYTLGFIKESGGTRTVVDGGYCHIDESSAVDIEENECGNEIDYTNGKYYTKTTLTYQMNGISDIVQACVRDESSAIDMLKDTTTCSASFDSGYYTPFYNWYIEKEGIYTALSDCLPDIENKQALQEEVCTGDDRYTLDNNNNRAYLNKTYYYEKNNNRIEVSHCLASDTVYNYITEIDEDICPVENNDNTLTTLQKGYNFFVGYEDERIEMKDKCMGIYPEIPYASNGFIWRQESINSREVGNSNDFNFSEFSYTSSINSWTWMYRCDYSNYFCYYYKDYKAINSLIPNYNLIVNFGSVYDDTNKNKIVKFQNYCLKGLTEPYDITSLNASIDVENSLEKPTYFMTGSNLPTTIRNVNVGAGSFTGTEYFATEPLNLIECSIPKCNVATINKYPIYLRGDNSEFINEDVTFETKYVCGANSPLIETRVEE